MSRLIFPRSRPGWPPNAAPPISARLSGRLDGIGHMGMELVEQTREIYDNYGYDTQILTAAVRHPEHVLQAALAGSDVVTMNLTS